MIQESSHRVYLLIDFYYVSKEICLYFKFTAVLHSGFTNDDKDNSEEYDEFQRPSEIQKKQKQKNAMADLVSRRKEKQEGLLSVLITDIFSNYLVSFIF